MSQPRALLVWLVGASLTSGAFAADAEVKKPAAAPPPSNTTKPGSVKPDLRFLEYLGSLESDDDNWTDVAEEALTGAANSQPVKSSQINSRTSAEESKR